MKKRIQLTTEQLDKVIRLRQANGFSWLGIQKETGISRRIAKREYLLWEQNQAREYLQTVRKDAAAEEFKRHLKMLLELAGQFASILRGPVSSDTQQSDQVFSYRIQYLKGFSDIQDDVLTVEGLTPRQRLWLYESLRSHTRESVPWDKLDYWKKQWNRSLEELQTLRGKTRLHFLQEQESELTDSQIKSLGNTVWEQVRLQILRGNFGPPAEDVFTGMIGALHGTEAIPTSDLERACRGEVERFLAEDEAGYARKALDRMSDAAKQLTEALDDIKLRPVLLRTRCDLCPA